jgi:hypothetical protein
VESINNIKEQRVGVLKLQCAADVDVDRLGPLSRSTTLMVTSHGSHVNKIKIKYLNLFTAFISIHTTQALASLSPPRLRLDWTLD